MSRNPINSKPGFQPAVTQLHTLVVIVLARLTGGGARPGDDLEALAGPLPDMAFETDTAVIRRYRESHFDDGLPVDPVFSGRI